jgi:stage V sporulation protein AE
MEKRKVILVTDGDMVAKKAVEIAAANIGGRCISASAGNPTVLTGHEILEKVKEAPEAPVVIMVDDRGARGEGPGEAAMQTVLDNADVDVLGVVAVSSNGKDCSRLDVTCSVTKDGKIVEGAVDKTGNEEHTGYICGDTLSILKNRKDLLIVGMGDPGKMDFMDEVSKGAPVTTRALQEVMKRKGLM